MFIVNDADLAFCVTNLLVSEEFIPNVVEVVREGSGRVAVVTGFRCCCDWKNVCEVLYKPATGRPRIRLSKL